MDGHDLVREVDHALEESHRVRIIRGGRKSLKVFGTVITQRNCASFGQRAACLAPYGRSWPPRGVS
jgi:hypothetical protein